MADWLTPEKALEYHPGFTALNTTDRLEQLLTMSVVTFASTPGAAEELSRMAAQLDRIVKTVLGEAPPRRHRKPRSVALVPPAQPPVTEDLVTTTP